MTDTIYWGVKLDDESVAKLLYSFPPEHSNVYAEHMTVSFRPSAEVDAKLRERLGEEVTLKVTGYAVDRYGQAVTVDGFPRTDPGVPHVTISTALGVGPVYSNRLVEKGVGPADYVLLTGKLLPFTRQGWYYGDQITS